MANHKQPFSLINNLEAVKYTITGKRGPIIFTRREIVCIFLLLRGETAKEMARRINVSHRTIESHLLKIRKKIGCFSRSQLINYIFESDFFQIVEKQANEAEIDNYLFMSKIS